MTSIKTTVILLIFGASLGGASVIFMLLNLDHPDSVMKAFVPLIFGWGMIHLGVATIGEEIPESKDCEKEELHSIQQEERG